MKYDKYGDPILEKEEKMSSKAQKAFLILTLVQVVLVLFNLSVLFIDFLNLYLCFLTAPIYIFFYIAYQKGCSNAKDNGNLPTIYKWVSIASPILYIGTAFLAIFSGV